MNVLLKNMYIHCMHAWFPQVPEEGVGSPGSRVTDSSEPPREYWELSMGHMKKQPTLLKWGCLDTSTDTQRDSNGGHKIGVMQVQSREEKSTRSWEGLLEQSSPLDTAEGAQP